MKHKGTPAMRLFLTQNEILKFINVGFVNIYTSDKFLWLQNLFS